MAENETSSGITPERLRQGAANAALCMGVGPADRVLILADEPRAHLAGLVAEACVLRGSSQPIIKMLEAYGARPLTAFPSSLRADLLAAAPTVTYYIATGQPGELGELVLGSEGDPSDRCRTLRVRPRCRAR